MIVYHYWIGAFVPKVGDKVTLPSGRKGTVITGNGSDGAIEKRKLTVRLTEENGDGHE